MATAGRDERTEHFRDTVKRRVRLLSGHGRPGPAALSRPLVGSGRRFGFKTHAHAVSYRTGQTGAGERTRQALPNSLVDRQRKTSRESTTCTRCPPPPRTTQLLRLRTQSFILRKCYRKAQIGERQREANRLHKILEDTGIKLDCVASDILGKSGRAMLDALVKGTTDPHALAELAQGKLRAKIPALKEALEGRFDAQHALIVSAILAHLDFLDEQIQLLSDEIEAQLAPFATAVELLCTIPGVQRRSAEVIVAEIGLDMSRFPSERHLASWAGQCPGNHRSAGKRRSGKTRHGSKWLDSALTEAAMAATRTNDVYLAAQYRRLRPRRGHGRALGAVKHSIITGCWHMLTTGELYREAGGDYFTRRDPERATRRLVAQLERLGHRVTLEAAAA